MTIAEKDLDFETHLLEYSVYLKGKAREDAPWHHKAQLVHCYSVVQAIGDLQSEIVIVGQNIGAGKIYHQLVYGAAFRSKLIWTALRTLLNLIPPDRIEPLPHDEVFEVSRALNDIYIHIRGMLDNYAWALIHLGNSEKLQKLQPAEVSLFSAKLFKDETLTRYQEAIVAFADWNRELRKLRDPVAHRIPLSVPPSVLDKDDLVRHNKAIGEWNAAVANWKTLWQSGATKEVLQAANEHADYLYTSIQKIGKFVSVVKHDPDENGVAVYPTVPQDVGMAVKLVTKLNVIMLSPH